MKIEILKYLAAVILAITSNAVFADTKPEFIALNFQGKILATNGTRGYVIDISKVKVMAQNTDYVMVKVYGTDIWILMKKNGELEVRKNKLQNTPFFVLAPLRTMEDSDDEAFAVAGMGWPNSSIVRYPEGFCTLCAAPTKLSLEAKKEATKEVLALRAVSSITQASSSN